MIGEHIDYCGYAVHPMAIEQDVLIAVSRNDSKILKLKNLESDQYQDFETDLGNDIKIELGQRHWWNYFLCGVKGVLEMEKISSRNGINCFVDGKIPPRAGLSSSSALVVSAALCK